MRHTTRRLLTGAALVLAAGTGLGMTPGSAYAAGVSATVDVAGQLKVRSAPSTTAKVVRSITDGRKVSIACAVNGPTVRGKVRTTKVWDRLTDGSYISHGYVRTSAKIQACRTTPSKATAPLYVTGTVRTSDGPVNARSGPGTGYAVAGSVANNTIVKIACAATGPSVAGTVRTSTQWDRLSDGRYIAHAYMLSGTVKTTCAPVAAPAPVLTPEQFIKAAVPGAQQGWREYGVPPSVTIAQAILESGWGRSGLSSVDRNYFGIKCQNDYHGPHATGCHVYRTTECSKSTGKCFEISDAFRTYSSMARSFRDHGHFLKNNKRYAPAFGHTRNADEFIEQVWKAGYATDPKYVAKVTGIMKTYGLYRYDTWK
ncbi:hypothetical protein ACTI_79820 [Actinoplanes sp. OR16]|uniref:sporangiospore maturation cell wall hydrolase GsmA n=1 Tax=Actinoplanes sp. OR16 TaxID=946334 RepID=UPI000F6F0EB6|nr:sporangiospore maturation cell wall hydrolase GsmA [Actinoplanes sp. OR16]BBH71297.1 hypothetical protein ACTI_79820 [Actinoplanes sp. OR16]